MSALPIGLAVVVMTLLVAMQPITTDLYLPALPLLVADLKTPVASVQLTLSSLMISYGLGQLAWGPVSDRLGRRPVLLTGLSLYALAAAGAACAPSVGPLIACRVLQGAALGAAVVCARAMVRDLYEPVEGTRIATLSLTGVGLVAMTVPVLGGWLATHWGWRAALWATALYALGTMLLIALRVPETLGVRATTPVRVGSMLRSYREIARNPAFLTWTGLSAFGYAANFSFYATSSYVFIGRMGLSGPQFGAVLGAASISYMLGTLLCRYWVGRHGVRIAVQRGGWLTMGAIAVWLVPTLTGGHTAWTLASGIWLQIFAYGIHQPCGQVGMVAPFKSHAGAASALGGCVLALGSFVASSWLGVVFDGSSRSLAWATALLVSPCALIALLVVRRYGGVTAEPLVVRAT